MVTNKGYYGNRQSLQSTLTPRQDMYARQDTRVEYQIFNSEYFSNADVKLYFGDIWVDDITSIAFQLSEEVLPIYGYHSYTMDAVARGKRLIQGAFSINFTSVGYLQQVVQNANAIFHAVSNGEKEGEIKPQYYQNLKLEEILTRLGKSSFDQIADEYENAIWGAQKDNGHYMSYDDAPYFYNSQFGFDIRVQYGAISESSGYISNQLYESNRFNKPSMTVDVINGVQLSGMSKSISTADQGAPIQEQYSFIARDLNGRSLASMSQGSNNENKEQSIETIYRPMQYGTIE
ncbi:hypothetical protein [Bacillus cereus]|uniref:hypothetical protein n=1 Tax=Bacillus cereus TaxID=1396 RepID=UPI00397FFADD